MGQGGGHRVLSRRLADTCGTKLSGNRVNESWRASGAAGWFVFQHHPSWSVGASVVRTGRDGEVRGWASQRQPQGSQRPITCCWTVGSCCLRAGRGWTHHWERFSSLWMQLSTLARDGAPPLVCLRSMTFQAGPADSHFRL